MTPLNALEARLAAWRPHTLLYLSRQPAPVLADTGGGPALAVTVRADVAGVQDLADETRYDCALVADLLEHLPKAQGIAVLGRLRNLHAARLLVFIDRDNAAASWSLDDFISLGFRHDNDLSDGTRTLSLYSYDLATYNHEREWNNPRFWANPELWGKYFW
ncbi:MAG: DUF6231 family protein [Pseudomonadota bacterium]